MKKQTLNLKLILTFTVLTIILTWLVILTWEQWLRQPFYTWVEAHYIGTDRQYRIEQRTEHFFISTAVDVIVVTLLLRLVSRQQRKLQASEVRYRTLFEHANDGIGVVTANDHRLVEVNNRFGEILGYQPQALLGKDIRDLVRGNGDRTASDAFIALLDRIDSGEGELTMQKAAGETLPVMVSFSKPSMEEEKLVVLIIRDLSERKRAEAKFSGLLESSPDGIVISRNDGKIVLINAQTEKLFGYRKDELLEQPIEMLMPDHLRNVHTGHRTGYISAPRIRPMGSGLNLIGRRKDGVEFPVEINLTPMFTEDGLLVISDIQDISETKRAKEALSKLSSAVEQTADTVAITDREGIIEYINPAFEKLAGYSLDEVVGKTFRILKSGKHDQEFYRNLWRTILSGQPFRGVLINKKKNGELYYEEKTVTPLKDGKGNTTHFVSTGKDITDRKQAEESLRDSEKRYRLMFKSNPLPMWVYDQETYALLDVNEAAVRHYGYSREEFLNMTIKDMLPSDGAPVVLHAGSTLREGSDAAPVWRHQMKEGTVIYVEISSHTLTFAGRPAEIVLANDVTERLKAEDALRESEERYRMLFTSANDGVFVNTLTPGGRVDQFIEVNDVACQSLGYSREELLKLTPTDINPHEFRDEVQSLMRRILSEKHLLFESVQVAKDGRRFPVEINLHLFDYRGQPLILSIVRDITERKQLEAEKEEMQRQLFQSSKLASIGELSAGVAHEIGNPLNSIINFGQLLKDAGIARSEIERQVIDGIIDEGGRIAKIVRDLLAFARRDSQELARVNIGETINNSMSLFGRQLDTDGISVEINVGEDIPPVMASGSLLRQVIVNMITNARHALRAKSTDSKVFRITVRAVGRGEGTIVRIEFFDNGVGIPRQNLDKVFDPFFTTRRDSGGTGLGLSLSFGIVRTYGGTVTVESEEGAFTRFRVELPAAPAGEEEYA
ncbi:MAG: PAS domain S-box protein [Acidobacteriia bacterium]|nr:PAS domain S-box protein [Terriglobia bacterium]